MQAARELFDAGLRTPQRLLAAQRPTLIDAFGRARYVRYDESSATRAIDIAAAVSDTYRGDLRRLDAAVGRDVARAERRLEEFKGIGTTGADILLREVQDTWRWVRPFFDRALTAAHELGLPGDPEKFAALAPRSCASLAAALVRVSLDDDLRADLT